MLGILVGVVGLGVSFSWRVLVTSRDIFVNEARKNPLTQILSILNPSDIPLTGESEDRVNILLIGIGGEDHPGPNLSDSIMLVSYQPSTHALALVSLPRDLYISTRDLGPLKINAIHAYGEARKEGSGPLALTEEIERLTGLSIPYFVRFDFIAFKKVVDAVGGIDVEVAETFYDYYQHQLFTKGRNHMNGERALYYVRGRFLEGTVGSDFTRAERQQAVLTSLAESSRGKNLFQHIELGLHLLSILSDHVRTNVDVTGLKRVASLFQTKGVPSPIITNVVSDDPAEGLLVASRTEAGGYILIPRAGAAGRIRTFFANVFSGAEAPLKPIALIIENGTKVAGVASKAAEGLPANQFTVREIRNATRQDFTDTILYDFTKGRAPDLVANLKERFKVTIVRTEVPADLDPGDAEAVLIIGQETADGLAASSKR